MDEVDSELRAEWSQAFESARRDGFPGWEFDWWGADLDGRIGCFMTAGMAYAPESVLSNLEWYIAVASYFRDRWSDSYFDFEKYGESHRLFVYDKHPGDRRRSTFHYMRIYVPSDPVRIDELPEPIKDIVGRTTVPWRFDVDVDVSIETMLRAERVIRF